jgi:hypothetical protein
VEAEGGEQEEWSVGGSCLLAGVIGDGEVGLVEDLAGGAPDGAMEAVANPVFCAGVRELHAERVGLQAGCGVREPEIEGLPRHLPAEVFEDGTPEGRDCVVIFLSVV